MSSLWEAVQEFLARIFGGSDTQRRLKVLDAMEEKFASARRDNEDSVHALKDEIRVLEARALQKKKEHDLARGDSKRVIAGEIERTFRELDRLHGREKVIAANLDRIGLASAKVAVAKVALNAGVTEDQFDDIALELQTLFGQLRESDRAARDLEQEEYRAPQASHVDVEKRMAEVAGSEKTSDGLSPETEQRLKQLETE
jgi:hypothetical protein